MLNASQSEGKMAEPQCAQSDRPPPITLDELRADKDKVLRHLLLARLDLTRALATLVKNNGDIHLIAGYVSTVRELSSAIRDIPQ
jgi:hypothetical protein